MPDFGAVAALMILGALGIGGKDTATAVDSRARRQGGVAFPVGASALLRSAAR